MFIVLCRGNYGVNKYSMATRRFFETEKEALDYASGIHALLDPIIAQISEKSVKLARLRRMLWNVEDLNFTRSEAKRKEEEEDTVVVDCSEDDSCGEFLGLTKP